MLERANKGMWNGGLVPFGYRVENKRLVIDKPEARIVQDLYDNYITSTRLDSRFRGNDKLSKGRIAYILRNPIYTGKIRCGGRLYQGNQKPIISEEIFNLAQEKHKEKKVVLRLYKTYPLAGLVNCKACNSHMTPCHTNKRNQNRLKRYYYYRCTKTFKKEWQS